LRQPLAGRHGLERIRERHKLLGSRCVFRLPLGGLTGRVISSQLWRRRPGPLVR
jgi:hypothetical protein